MDKNNYFKKLRLLGFHDDFINEILDNYNDCLNNKISFLNKNKKNAEIVSFLKHLINKNKEKEYFNLINTYFSLEQKYFSRKFKYIHPFRYFCDQNKLYAFKFASFSFKVFSSPHYNFEIIKCIF